MSELAVVQLVSVMTLGFNDVRERESRIVCYS